MIAEVTTRLTIPGTQLAVREALRTLRDGALCRLSDNDCSTAQIVLAEALNNIVEHAYAETEGEIGLHLWFDRRGMRCVLTDQGRPMPDGRLPAGKPPRPEDLPEGGFGWSLIRSLARELHYRRVEGRNELSFRLPRNA